jgi:thiol-disulfide isomerase/thioredoxin
MGELLEFTGRECTHCREMDPLIERLEKEEGIAIEKLEVWHNPENAKLMEELDQVKCGGVPFFYNKKTGTWICGSTSYEKLKTWATGD